jgi:hypothetical protein
VYIRAVTWLAAAIKARLPLSALRRRIASQPHHSLGFLNDSD